MSVWLAILISVAIVVVCNALLYAMLVLHYSSKRRAYRAQALREFDAEFGTLPKKARRA